MPRSQKAKEKQGLRQTYFCIGFSNFWTNPLYKILKDLRNKHKLPWLRISMSYHKFSNLREIFQGDLSRKIMENIHSRDFINRTCNCNKNTKINGIAHTKKNADTQWSFTPSLARIASSSTQDKLKQL